MPPPFGVFFLSDGAMKKSKNFFYRIDAGPLLAEIIQTPEEDRGKKFLQLAIDMMNGKGTFPYSKQIIAEANAFRVKKSDAGKKGMENRWLHDNSVITENNTDITEDNRTITRGVITRSSNRSSTESEEEHKPKVKRFVPPSVPEVEAYMKEIGWNGDAQNFVDHYEARGWIPKGYTQQMKSWKAAVRTWRGNDNGNRNAKRPDTASLDAAYDEFKRAANADKARILGG